MIELRLLQTVNRDGMGNPAQLQESPVLQFRTLQPVIDMMGITYQFKDEWSEWKDVPTVKVDL